MKRFHVHLGVESLPASIAFYSNLFGAEPSVVKSDYAKWMREDPRVNFAISEGHAARGIEHLGIQAEDEAELAEVYARLEAAHRSLSFPERPAQSGPRLPQVFGRADGGAHCDRIAGG